MELKYPNKNWSKIWTNISNKILTTEVQVAWYGVINNIVSTNVKLYSIGLSVINACPKCNNIDSLYHRFNYSGYNDIWNDIRQQIAFIKRSDGREITITNLFFPDEVSFPTQRNNVIVWLLGTFVNYVINKSRK